MRYHENTTAVEAKCLDHLEREGNALLLGAWQEVPRGAARSPYVDQLRKDIARRQVKPVRMILAVLLEALGAGGAHDDAEQFAQWLLDVVRAQRPTPALRLAESEVQQREAAAEGALNQCQMRRAYDRSPAVLREIVDRGVDHLEALERVVTWARTELYGGAVAGAVAGTITPTADPRARERRSVRVTA